MTEPIHNYSTAGEFARFLGISDERALEILTAHGAMGYGDALTTPLANAAYESGYIPEADVWIEALKAEAGAVAVDV